MTFILSYFKKTNKKITFNYKDSLKYGTIISIIVLSCISYFFIRNYFINKGDILGINSFLEACEIGAIDSLKPSLRNTPENLEMSYLEMLTTTYYGNPSWIITTIISFIGILFIIIKTLLYGDPVGGWPSLVCIIFMVSGIQLFCMGIIGEYLAKTYLETKNRPIYIVKERSEDIGISN